MTTLIDLIKRSENLIRETKGYLVTLQQQHEEILKMRHSCNHEFGQPYPGYEHEGATCKLCGINELHAEQYKIGSKY